jgi:proteasome accessory factor C
MRLTTRELCALELGLAMLRSECPPAEYPAIDRARERVRDAATELAMQDGRDELWSAAVATDGDQTCLLTLRTAYRQRRKVRLVYRGGDDMEATIRVVCPYRFVFTNGMWYIVAHCERTKSIRFFRLDRIESAEMTEESFELPEHSKLDAITGDGRMVEGIPEETMTVRYSARIARWIAEREGVPVDTDGALTLEHPVYDRQWAVRHVLRYGPEAEVLGPPVMRELVAARLQALCRSII